MHKSALLILSLCLLGPQTHAEHEAPSKAGDGSRRASPYWSPKQLDDARLKFADTIMQSPEYKAADGALSKLAPCLETPIAPSDLAFPKDRVEQAAKILEQSYEDRGKLTADADKKDRFLQRRLSLSAAGKKGELPTLAFEDWLTVLKEFQADARRASFTKKETDKTLMDFSIATWKQMLTHVPKIFEKCGFTVISSRHVLPKPEDQMKAWNDHYLLGTPDGQRLVVSIGNTSLSFQKNSDAKAFEEAKHPAQGAIAESKLAIPESEKTTAAKISVDLDILRGTKFARIGSQDPARFIETELFAAHKSSVKYSNAAFARVEEAKKNPKKDWRGMTVDPEMELLRDFSNHSQLPNDAISDKFESP